jgi:hypothetical protein
MSPQLPSVLYRFRPWSVVKPGGMERKSLSEVEGKYAYFSSPLKFNDLQDCVLGPELTGGKGDIERIFFHGLADATRLAREKKCSVLDLKTDDPAVQASEELYQRREARKNTRVCCFSWDWSNPLMWTFYAQEHQGFCLGYSTSGELLGRARPVLYTHSPSEVLHLKDPATGNDALSFCKSTDWQFEKEWRVCLPEPEPKRVELAAEELVSVHIGYRMKDQQLQELVEALRKAGHKPEGTKLFSIERLPMSFALCQRAIGWQC